MWSGIWKLLLGMKGHANWHFTDDSCKPPTRLAMFVLRSENPAWYEVLAWRLEESPLRPFMRLIALGYEFEAWTELPDTLRDLVLFVPHLLAALGRCILRRPAPEAEEEANAEGSELSDEAAGRQEQFRKRLCAAAGLLGIYMVWTIFSWFIFVCTAPACMHARVLAPRILTRGTRSDGMLIYKQLGSDAERQFANQWGVGYAMDKCGAGLSAYALPQALTRARRAPCVQRV